MIRLRALWKCCTLMCICCIYDNACDSLVTLMCVDLCPSSSFYRLISVLMSGFFKRLQFYPFHIGVRVFYVVQIDTKGFDYGSNTVIERDQATDWQLRLTSPGRQRMMSSVMTLCHWHILADGLFLRCFSLRKWWSCVNYFDPDSKSDFLQTFY